MGVLNSYFIFNIYFYPYNSGSITIFIRLDANVQSDDFGIGRLCYAHISPLIHVRDLSKIVSIFFNITSSFCEHFFNFS